MFRLAALAMLLSATIPVSMIRLSRSRFSSEWDLTSCHALSGRWITRRVCCGFPLETHEQACPSEGESMTVLDMIGRTRLIPLQRMVPDGSARVLIKLEYENPTGSMKDRMALAMVEAAEKDGRLRPGASVIEYTGGSTGVSLAFVCAAKQIPLASGPRGHFAESRLGFESMTNRCESSRWSPKSPRCCREEQADRTRSKVSAPGS